MYNNNNKFLIIVIVDPGLQPVTLTRLAPFSYFVRKPEELNSTPVFPSFRIPGNVRFY